MYDQNFYGGVVDGEGVAVKDASSLLISLYSDQVKLKTLTVSQW